MRNAFTAERAARARGDPVAIGRASPRASNRLEARLKPAEVIALILNHQLKLVASNSFTW